MSLDHRVDPGSAQGYGLEDSIVPVEAPARSWLGLVPKPVKYLVGAAATAAVLLFGATACGTTSSNPNPPPPTPGVEITAPTSGSTFTGPNFPLKLTYSATGFSGTCAEELDGTTLPDSQNSTTGSFDNLYLEQGTHTFKVVCDNNGTPITSSTSTITVDVHNNFTCQPDMSAQAYADTIWTSGTDPRAGSFPLTVQEFGPNDAEGCFTDLQHRIITAEVNAIKAGAPTTTIQDWITYFTDGGAMTATAMEETVIQVPYAQQFRSDFPWPLAANIGQVADYKLSSVGRMPGRWADPALNGGITPPIHYPVNDKLKAALPANWGNDNPVAANAKTYMSTFAGLAQCNNTILEVVTGTLDYFPYLVPDPNSPTHRQILWYMVNSIALEDAQVTDVSLNPAGSTSSHDDWEVTTTTFVLPMDRTLDDVPGNVIQDTYAHILPTQESYGTNAPKSDFPAVGSWLSFGQQMGWIDPYTGSPELDYTRWTYTSKDGRTYEFGPKVGDATIIDPGAQKYNVPGVANYTPHGQMSYIGISRDNVSQNSCALGVNEPLTFK